MADYQDKWKVFRKRGSTYAPITVEGRKVLAEAEVSLVEDVWMTAPVGGWFTFTSYQSAAAFAGSFAHYPADELVTLAVQVKDKVKLPAGYVAIDSLAGATDVWDGTQPPMLRWAPGTEAFQQLRIPS